MKSVAALILTVLSAATLAADNWPAWRGPDATGVSTETNLPERWGPKESIAWEAPLRGAGVSSPVIFGDRVFVTSQEGAGVRRRGNHPSLVQGPDRESSGERTLTGARASDSTRFIVSDFDRNTGRRAWEHVFEAKGTLP